MGDSKEGAAKIREELEWISLNKEYGGVKERVASQGVFGFLVPIGCLVTAGILGYGIYTMAKGDSKKQQLLMRYRVLAQGTTLLMTAVGLYSFKFQK